jgi:hypothetical protein
MIRWSGLSARTVARARAVWGLAKAPTTMRKLASEKLYTLYSASTLITVDGTQLDLEE